MRALTVNIYQLIYIKCFVIIVMVVIIAMVPIVLRVVAMIGRLTVVDGTD